MVDIKTRTIIDIKEKKLTVCLLPITVQRITNGSFYILAEGLAGFNKF